ncbi:MULTISPECIES: hypothetical protein [unclassified Microcoleus]|uniref:hypothetical protein n=1 Tax=unclassified Microcoleus TaxID=2642155 RepID=UPI002FD7986C
MTINFGRSPIARPAKKSPAFGAGLILLFFSPLGVDIVCVAAVSTAEAIGETIGRSIALTS